MLAVAFIRSTKKFMRHDTATRLGMLGRRALGMSPSQRLFMAMAGQPMAPCMNLLKSKSMQALWGDVQSSLLAQKHQLRQRMSVLEQKALTIINSVSFSPSGKTVASSIIPLSILIHLFPSRFQSLAHAPPHPRTHALPLPIISDKTKAAFHAASHTYTGYLEELCIFIRGIYLMLLFTPVILSAPFVFYLHHGREWWIDLLCRTLERAGPAFIKWGQWGSTRPDLFPPDLCSSLERLQTNAPSHPGNYSNLAVEASFNKPVHALFDTFDPLPVASGSIAQIHRARLSHVGAVGTGLKPGTVVAVKVRHPGVTVTMHRDFVLMQRAAKACSALPGLKDLRLDESIRQFGGPLKEQLDLSVEAKHLSRFRHNFRFWPSVSFPNPIYPLVSPDVLVESFEEGYHVSNLVNYPGHKHSALIAETGMYMFLQMLFRDNFIHADMHPGNILVREADHSGPFKALKRIFALEFSPQLVMLDTGMIAELTHSDQQSLIKFFRALTKQDGENIGNAILDMSERHTCPNPAGFITELRTMFDSLDQETISNQSTEVFQDIINTIRSHQVTLRSTVSTVVVTTLVLEGWSNKLHPGLRILEGVRDLLHVDWSDRISRAVDKVMSSGTVAMA